MQKLTARAYNRFKVDTVRGTITKSSSTLRLRDEILYYKMLSNLYSEQSIYFPRLLDSYHQMHDGNGEYWMELEFYDYNNLSQLISKKSTNWENIFTKLKHVLLEWSQLHPFVKWTTDDIRSAAYDMYITKTEKEFDNFYNGWHDKFEALFDTQTRVLIINRKQYNNFAIIWPRIKIYIENNMLNFTPSIIHGDFCFSNILHSTDNDVVRFIDPRGSFGKTGIFGDARYDVAKLYHSVDGKYDAIINYQFIVNSHGNIHELMISPFSAISKFEQIFFPTFNKKEIKILQGCIFIGMCARHYDSIERQHAMYLTGIRLLNEALEL
jgi:hypothetical protein